MYAEAHKLHVKQINMIIYSRYEMQTKFMTPPHSFESILYNTIVENPRDRESSVTFDCVLIKR